ASADSVEQFRITGEGIGVARGGLQATTGGVTVGAGGVHVDGGGIVVNSGPLSVIAGVAEFGSSVDITDGGLVVTDSASNQPTVRIDQTSVGFAHTLLEMETAMSTADSYNFLTITTSSNEMFKMAGTGRIESTVLTQDDDDATILLRRGNIVSGESN
ncbi:unnamed protein product, partial [Symbiodinium sp. KB8]